MNDPISKYTIYSLLALCVATTACSNSGASAESPISSGFGGIFAGSTATNGGTGSTGLGKAGTYGSYGGSTLGGFGGSGAGTSGKTEASVGTAGASGARAGDSAAGTGGTNTTGTAGASGTSGSNSGTTAGIGGSSTKVATTPPMGWNSWNTFACNPSESLIKGIADTFVSSGMAAVGYQYVNIDDCWMSGRDASGTLQWDKSKFPSGIPALADYVHSKGLKLGIYETPSNTTCAGKTGGQGHEQQDAKTFASWGVDYLKYDHCRTTDMKSFARMHDALFATGRPIFYSINPVYGPGSCVPPTCSVDLLKIANMWRIGFDINASWGSVTGLIDINKPLSQYAGPGHWNDPDMLEVGRGMSADEDRAHFGMWAIMAAPLLAGNDIRSMSATTKATLTNADVIAVDQDPLGVQGNVAATPGPNLEVWSKQLSGIDVRAVGLLNRSEATASITAQWSALGIPTGAATVRDLWNQKDLGSFTGSYTASSVPRHGMVMLKVTSNQSASANLSAKRSLTF